VIQWIARHYLGPSISHLIYRLAIIKEFWEITALMPYTMACERVAVGIPHSTVVIEIGEFC
jgi:hypothetical protein